MQIRNNSVFRSNHGQLATLHANLSPRTVMKISRLFSRSRQIFCRWPSRPVQPGFAASQRKEEVSHVTLVACVDSSISHLLLHHRSSGDLPDVDRDSSIELH